MAGSLFHSREFRAESYVASDGTSHHEIVTVDGRVEGVSYSTWAELKRFGESHRIATDVWPEFVDCEFGIDIPIRSIGPKSDRFRAAIVDFDRTAPSPHWFAKILEYLDAGEYVFFC